jgi:hypothetical protein
MKETLPTNTDVSKVLNTTVSSVITDKTLMGFEKAYQIASATAKLKELLTADYMKPIMALQGNKLGFKTDKDDKGGYDINIVKNCLIEAVLTGLQPCGNQFNIIAGNCYTTKEGFGYLLKNMIGLAYEIIPLLPRVNADKTSAAITMKIEWTINGEKNEREIEFPIKMNAYMGTDAIIGKATRKARAWLYNTINDCEIADGDISDIPHEVVGTKINKQDKQGERIFLMIDSAKTLKDLEDIASTVGEFTSPQQDAFDNKKEKLGKQ